MTYSDAQLRAYLKGMLSQDQAEALEAQVAQDAVLEARLFALDFDRAGALRAAFDAVPETDVLQDLEGGLPNAKAQAAGVFPARFWIGAGIVASVAFATGAFLFDAETAASDPRWQDLVAAYQSLYVTETLAPIAADNEQLTAQLSRAARRLGRALPLDVVSDLGGLELLRAQILGFDDTPLIQLAYLSEDGMPVALCAIQRAGPTVGEFTFEVLAGLQSVHWSDGTFSYMIVGDIENDRLSEMAESVRNTL
ncbi:anti-sigma factor family protein [Roseovarius sp. S1116L3]|uniref:anti-sigma factor family protein n=1 Tax=Roseovarius roseus TaxID=3342636 RepID=UPI0037268266